MNQNETTSMTNPYRALCAQLVDLLQPYVTKADSEILALGYYSQAQQFIDRTRCQLGRSVDDDRRALEPLPFTNLTP